VPAPPPSRWRVALVIALLTAAAGCDETPDEADPDPSSPPTWFPGVTVERTSEDAHQGFLVTSLVAVRSAPVILDADGEYAWWYAPPEIDYRITRATLSRDGSAVLYLGYVPPSEGLSFETRDLVRVPLDGSAPEVIELTGPHHDFVELPDGTIATIAYDTREVDGEEVVGDRVLELRPDGSEVEIWSAWDDFEFAGQGETTLGWTHANALDYDEADDAYYVSLCNLSSIVKVDRASGQMLWRLGGSAGDFELQPDPGPLFDSQHQFQRLDGGIVVFDNQLEDFDGSRVVQYDLDANAGTAEQRWLYRADPPLVCIALGDVHRFDDGDTLVTWSSAGQVDRVSADGEVVWQLNTGFGGALGYTTWLESLPDTLE